MCVNAPAAAWVLAGFIAAGCAGARPLPPPPATIRDDVRLQAAVESARADFLPAGRLDRLDVTVLLAAPDGSWRRGSVGGQAPWYPASCVKLGFAVAAVHWCESGGRPPDCLDDHLAPMLIDSDNVATGYVVDAITGAPNGPPGDADAESWLEKRLYTERLLDRHGLLDGQRLVHKTYPTNSGEMPEGLEALARERLGRNLMHADGSARLMLALVTGEFGAPATDYLRSRLRRPQVSHNSAMGGGFPDGTVYESKIGEAYQVFAEIVHAELPEGADEQDPTALAVFARLLLERLAPLDD